MSRVLLVGGTGSIARLVAARLPELGDCARVLTRDSDRARAALPAGVEVTTGDLTDTASLVPALDDVDSMVMTHAAPYGSGDYENIDYGAVPALLAALDGRQVRVALMSSIGVTSTRGSSRELLNWKRRGERLLRTSGLPYTIVRPGWFDAGNGSEQHIELRQGDPTEYGPVRCAHVAEVLAQALRTPAALGRTVEVFSTDGAPTTEWEALFAGTDSDTAGMLDEAQDRDGLPLDREPGRIQADLRRWHGHR
jgi:uncharacterized protein YbjT (DUF2867 family)